MNSPYKMYGIPKELRSFKNELPDYAIIYYYDLAIDEFRDSFGLTPDKMQIWGKANYWTALEAALLLAGLSPDGNDLYLVVIYEVDEDLGAVYTWKHAEKFDAARDYLFLFERSELAPEASPIEWVKYFHQKICNSPIKNNIGVNEILSYERWDHFFDLEFNENNQTENLISTLLENPSRREQQYEVILTVITALNYDPKRIPDGGKAKIKNICLTRPRLFTDAGFDHAWKDGVSAGHFKLANHEKFSPSK